MRSNLQVAIEERADLLKRLDEGIQQDHVRRQSMRELDMELDIMFLKLMRGERLED